MIRPEPLDDALLENLIVEQTTDNTVGFILTGSFNRNDWTEYSDVDLVQFVRILPEDEKERYSLRYVNNRLVSLSKTTIE
ncbi:MAG: nucleotidyltransferase domain-containing protein, partial [Candidatus Thorarchaeota archaeon]